MRLHRGPGQGGTPLLVLHDTGAPGAGADWQPLLDLWPGASLAPDLPGHGGSEPAVGGKYIPSDWALVAQELLAAGEPGPPPVLVLGHGWGAYAGELLAAGGRAGWLVLVDGLGGPWLTEEEIALDQTRWLRAVLDDPDATRAPEGPSDPLLAHGFPSVWEPGFTAALRAAIEVPVLALETPLSPTPPGERAERAAAFGGPHCVLTLDAPRAQDAAGEIAASVLGWSGRWT